MKIINVKPDTFSALYAIKKVMGQEDLDDTIKYLIAHAKAMRGPLENWNPKNLVDSDE